MNGAIATHINIDHMTEDELHVPNLRTIARLKLLQQRHTINSMLKFHVGRRMKLEP
jgi:hypothetical protein